MLNFSFLDKARGFTHNWKSSVILGPRNKCSYLRLSDFKTCFKLQLANGGIFFRQEIGLAGFILSIAIDSWNFHLIYAELLASLYLILIHTRLENYGPLSGACRVSTKYLSIAQSEPSFRLKNMRPFTSRKSHWLSLYYSSFRMILFVKGVRNSRYFGDSMVGM